MRACMVPEGEQKTGEREEKSKILLKSEEERMFATLLSIIILYISCISNHMVEERL